MSLILLWVPSPGSLLCMLTTEDVDALVTRVHAQYASCNFRPSNDYQYTVLAALALQTSPPIDLDATLNSSSDSGCLKVVALATGAKCLPTARYPPRGDALHDSHAEVLARRAFVKWLYEEVLRAMQVPNGSMWIKRRTDGKWGLRDAVRLHMYISTVPCKKLSPLCRTKHDSICHSRIRAS